MNKKYSIEGMHCKSCEILIEDELKKVAGIKKVKANFRSGFIEVFSKDKINDVLISKAIERAGYRIGDKKRPWFSRNPKNYSNLLFAFIIFLLIYYLIKKLGLFNISFTKGNISSLSVVLLIGLTAGVSTCMALVGGLVLSITSRFIEKHPESTSIQKFRPHLFFNLGRILTFFILGGFIGLIGKSFQFSNSIFGILMIIVSIVMIILGLQLIEIFPKISNYKLTLPTSILKILSIEDKHQKEYSHLNSMILGGLTFFLPCGFTQTMQLYAVTTGNFFSGALVMSIFALGTAPGLLGIGALTSFVKGTFAKSFFVFIGIVVIVLAIINFKNGYGLLGLKINNENNNQQSQVSNPNVKVENGIQIVKMTQSERGYSPNKFTIKKGIPVKWIINSTSSYTCASALVSSQLGISQFLQSGENTFEFTPQKVGTISFSCSMGMYRGEFKVIE